MTEQNTVQELKADRVQEESMARVLDLAEQLG